MTAPVARDGRVRLGGPAAKRARRAELEYWVAHHLGSHPDSWISAVELARLIRDRYIPEPRPVTSDGYHYGRSNVVVKILLGLERDGSVRCRQNPGRKNGRQWQWAGGDAA